MRTNVGAGGARGGESVATASSGHRYGRSTVLPPSTEVLQHSGPVCLRVRCNSLTTCTLAKHMVIKVLGDHDHARCFPPRHR